MSFFDLNLDAKFENVPPKMEEPYLLCFGGADIWRFVFEICLDWKRPSLKKALLVPCWIFEAAAEDGAEVVVVTGGGSEDEAAAVLSIVVWLMSFYSKNKNETSIHITVNVKTQDTTSSF